MARPQARRKKQTTPWAETSRLRRIIRPSSKAATGLAPSSFGGASVGGGATGDFGGGKCTRMGLPGGPATEGCGPATGAPEDSAPSLSPASGVELTRRR